jgi:hypothetical protein
MKWMVKTEDPLIEGKVAKLLGAVVNTRTCIHPDSKNPKDYE